MNIDSLTFAQIKEISTLLNLKGGAESPLQPYKIGENYIFRTVTHIDVGTVVAVGDKEIVIVDASWVADTGRYADAIATGTLREVEPYLNNAEVIVGRGAVVDATKWIHPLPRTQK